jgi:uncharacterized circularly permuted ATP-grasp superfamily protein
LKRGKLRDFNTLIENKELLPHLPTTKALTKTSLHDLLQEHPLCYLKPDAASQGHGILRVKRKESGAYLLQTMDMKHSSLHSHIPRLEKRIKQWMLKKPYIIQQGITSHTTWGYPFDIRLHVVRVEGVWTFGGMIGKVAKKKSVVTNASQGAIPTHIDTVLTTYLELEETAKQTIKDEMEKLALTVATVMGESHPD